jgi:hypothetical protein
LIPIRASTASTIIVGPFLDDTDGKTPETAIDVTTIDCDLYKRSTKYDLTLTASGGDNDCVHVANGYYSLELTTGNTDTTGRARITFNVSGAMPVWEDLDIQWVRYYDPKYTDDYWEVDLRQIVGVTQSATDLKDFADTGYNPSTHKVQGVVLADTVTTLTGHTAQTGDSYARLGAPAGASIAADLLTIDNLVDDLESRLTTARAGYLDNLSGGAVALASTALTNATWTDTKAGYLDNLSGGAVALASTALSSANWTNTRAGYLDNLSGGAVALEANALSSATWTSTRAGYLDNLSGGAVALEANALSSSTWTNTRAGYLDNLPTISSSVSTIDSKVDAIDNYIDTEITAILEDTGTSLPATLATIEGKIDSVDNYIDTEVTAILEDTGTTLPATLATILADTAELQGDLANGGRLDLLIDAIKAKTDNLPDGIKKNTAFTAFTFLLVDSTDHVTAKTGRFVSGSYSGDGGAPTALTNSGSITEIGSGLYEIDLTAAELNYNTVTLIFTASGADTRVITIHPST